MATLELAAAGSPATNTPVTGLLPPTGTPPVLADGIAARHRGTQRDRAHARRGAATAGAQAGTNPRGSEIEDGGTACVEVALAVVGAGRDRVGVCAVGRLGAGADHHPRT